MTVLLISNDQLNMFRANFCSSSGAQDWGFFTSCGIVSCCCGRQGFGAQQCGTMCTVWRKLLEVYVTSKISYKLEFYVLKCLFSVILLYRVCRCCLECVWICSTQYSKYSPHCALLWASLYFQTHNLKPTGAIPNFYLHHSWVLLVTMVFYAVQVLKVKF